MDVIEQIATVAVVGASLGLVALTRGRRIAWTRPLFGAAAGFATFNAYLLIERAAAAVRQPPLWDFKVFWMIAQVAAMQHNVYDAASYQSFRGALNPTDDVEFNRIALDIGMPYPPPAILLLYPLGFIHSVPAALTVWYGALFATIGACVVLVWRRFFATEGLAGLAVVAVLFTALSSTWLTIDLGQLDFFALLLLLLFWDEPVSWRAGALLAPLVVLRPLCVLLGVYLLVRRRWTAVAAATLAGVALLAVSLPLIGPAGLASYLHQNPTARYPETYFIGTQSLYKFLVKISGHADGYFSLAAHPLYDVIAIVSIIGAGVICAISRPERRDACLGLLLALALLLYPNTDTHYCSLMLVPLCAIWRERERYGLPAGVVIAAFVLQYLLLDLRGGASTTGLALALDCFFFGLLALRTPVGRALHAVPQPARFRPRPIGP